MKKLLLLSISILACVMTFAQGQEVNMGWVDPSEWQGPHKSPTLLPRVSYDSQNLYIWSPYTIDLLQVIIRDEDDDIIYSNVCMPLVQEMTTFALPSTVCTDKYSIELIYGDHHLIGYF
ncbi:MAG: DUF3244 domain-containing protein [Prevotella sp.]|nr:DUF3244 domain-containing protein [Prevotella sp.]